MGLLFKTIPFFKNQNNSFLQIIPNRYKHCSSNLPVRVRFAPSPTGFVHLGGLRTTFYNYLFAKKHNGKFILRIEDTDQERIVPGSLESIIEILKWSNLIPDEGPTFGGEHGPYIQSERMDLYREMIGRLLQTDSVYRCFCTSKRLELLRREAAKNREIPKYDNLCRSLTTEEISRNLSENKPFTVRLKLKKGPMTIQDLVYGPVTYDLSQIESDPIIFKSDGLPTYHFANVVDDYFMKISHVLRGVEWLVSTPKHLMLYEAFGWNPPQYAHLPLLINKDGSKLSKRHDHIRISTFQEEGFYPETIVNYMTQIGGGFNKLNTADCDKIYSIDQLTNSFNLESINQNNCKIDHEKIRLLNRIHMQNMINEDFDRLLGDLKKILHEQKDKFNDEIKLNDDNYVQKILKWSLERIFTLKDLVSDDFLFLWSAPKLTWNVENLKNNPENLISSLKETITVLEQIDPIDFEDKDKILKSLRNLNENDPNEMKFSVYMKLLRLSLTNLKVGPPVAESMCLLGPDRTKQYLNKAIDYVKNC